MSSRRADQRDAVYSAGVTCTKTKAGNCRPAERRSFTVKDWPSEIEAAVEGARKKVEGRRAGVEEFLLDRFRRGPFVSLLAAAPRVRMG